MKEATNTSNREDFSRFGKRFQERLCQLILDDRMFCDQLKETLKTEYFESKYLQVFVSKIFSYKDRFKTHPSRDTLTIIFRVELENEPEILRNQVREFYARVLSAPLNEEDNDYIKTTALDFCKKQALKVAMMQSIHLMSDQETSFDSISKLLNDALGLSMDNNFGTEYVVDLERRYNPKTRMPITTGWTEFDEIMQGGLGRRELGVIIAPTGRGKTHVLCHLGAVAVKLGLNVVHFTMELSEEYVGLRYDSIMTGINTNCIMQFKDKVCEKIVDLPGQLKIKFYNRNSKTVNSLRSYLDKVQRTGFKTDLVIVDYGDLLKPLSTRRDGRADKEIASVYDDLINLAEDYDCAVWSASQTHRDGANEAIITMESIADAYAKCFGAHFVFSLSRTNDDKANNSGRFFVAKNRSGIDGVVYPIHFDASISRIEILPNNGETVSGVVEKAAKKQKEYLLRKYNEFQGKQPEKKVLDMQKSA